MPPAVASPRSLSSPRQQHQPGPGSHSPTNRLTRNMAPAITMGAQLRLPIAHNSCGPGPACFLPNDRSTTSSSPRYSMASRAHAGTRYVNSAGPGDYSPNSAMSSVRPPVYSIPRSARDWRERHDYETPGPAKYSPVPAAVALKTPQYTMGRRRPVSARKREQGSGVPDPGHYEAADAHKTLAAGARARPASSGWAKSRVNRFAEPSW